VDLDLDLDLDLEEEEEDLNLDLPPWDLTTSLHVVQCVDTVKDLGMHVDENLKFMTHINKTVAKAQSRANVIHKFFILKILQH